MEIAVAAYIRVSTDEQAEQGISIAAQKNRIEAYCRAQNWTPYDFYCDDGWSGKDLRRPAIQRLVADAAARKFSHVVVIKLDRLSRRQKDILYLLEDVFEPAGVGFQSVTEPFDTTTPFGKAAVGMMAVFAQLERETIVERIKIAKKEAARQGLYLGGPAPFGYVWRRAQKSMTIDRSRADVVREIYDWYTAGGRGYQAIANALNQANAPGPGNCPGGWSRQSVRAILRNPFYAGFVKYENAMNEGKHEAIVSREIFFAAQKKRSVRAAPASGLLTGLIFCAECGARMRLKKAAPSAKSPEKTNAYYVCYSQDGSSKEMIKDAACKPGYKRADALEQAVLDALRGYRLDDAAILKAARQALGGAAARLPIGKLGKQLAAIDASLRKWAQFFESDEISAGELAARVKQLRDRKACLRRQMRDAKQARAARQEGEIDVGRLTSAMKRLDAIFAVAEPEELRAIVAGLIDKIYVSENNQIRIEYA